MTQSHERSSSIEELAAEWLAAERAASERGNAGGTEDRARMASAAYEAAVKAASREDLLVAWHAAQKIQYAAEMGSTPWVQARAVSELIRMEFQVSE